MLLSPNQLNTALGQPLATIYCVGGEDPLLIVEAADAIRAAAKTGGFTEREVMHVEAGFSWSNLRAAGQSMSLFGDKKLIELHLPGSPGKEGGAALKAAAEQPAEDTMILLRCGALDGRQRKSAWFSAIDKHGVAVYGWAPKGRDLGRWVAQRARGAGLQLTQPAIDLLAERVEGNLLAAAQDIDKLSLLFGEREIGPDDILESVADHARFAVFDLVDRALAGDSPGALRTLARLQEEGVDAVPLAWHLTHSARVLADAKSGSVSQACRNHRVFGRRQKLFEQAAARHSAGSARWLLAAAGAADRTCKGAQMGNAWDSLVTLTMVLASGAAARGWMQAAQVRLDA